MQTPSTSAHAAASLLPFAARPRQASFIAATAASTASTAASADRATISQAARDLLAAQSGAAAPSRSGAKAVFDTDQGALSLNVDEYFTPPANAGGAGFSLPPLLLPTQRNIDALAGHISAAMPQFLAQNGIPSAPATITYDGAGQMQLPADYAYAAEFRQALANDPALARELSTVNALTSHMVEMKKSIPFQQEYAAAATQAAADAVVAKYSHLFSGSRHYDAIALQFSASGSLTLTADGKPLS